MAEQKMPATALPAEVHASRGAKSRRWLSENGASFETVAEMAGEWSAQAKAAAAEAAAKMLKTRISRLIHEVRRPRKKRHALSGRPRWKTLTSNPACSAAKAARPRLGAMAENWGRAVARPRTIDK